VNQLSLVDVPPIPPQPTLPPPGERYPLEVEAWGEDGELLVSRGHHDSWSFRVAAQIVCVDDLEDLEAAGRAGVVEVHRDWWRHQPSRTMGAGTEWEGQRSYKQASGPGPGAFPVTFLWVG
jgi:hypothetical protein